MAQVWTDDGSNRQADTRMAVKVYVRRDKTGRMVETARARRKPKGSGWSQADLTPAIRLLGRSYW